LIEPIEYENAESASDRANDLLRQSAALLNLVVEGDVGDADLLADVSDESADVERKYTELRAAETTAALRSWYVKAFGPSYEKELGWV
jgi:hypothetical protein